MNIGYFCSRLASAQGTLRSFPPHLLQTHSTLVLCPFPSVVATAVLCTVLCAGLATRATSQTLPTSPRTLPAPVRPSSESTSNLSASELAVLVDKTDTLMSQGRYDVAVALLKPFVRRWGRTSPEGANASYLLATVLQDSGWFTQALAEATALQQVLTPSDKAAGNDTITPQELTALVDTLRPLAFQEGRLVTLAAQHQSPASALYFQGKLADLRARPDLALTFYRAASLALSREPAATPATRLQVEQAYVHAVFRRSSSEHTALVPLILRLLTADGFSSAEHRLGLAAAARLLGREPAAVSDADIPGAARTAVEALLGTQPALTSGLLGRLVMALCPDGRGGLWVGTEDQGVWHFDPQPNAQARQAHWTQFTAESTEGDLGDDSIYALCRDHQGRLWAGTLRHGVCVFNGRVWRTFGPREGLSGSRVFAAACCPSTGDVWIATEGGLSRYLPATDHWRTYSRLDGLPSNGVNSLAFSKRGDVYAGTLADGIATASPAADYGHWRSIPGPIRAPAATGGVGLPSSSVNCLLVARDGTVYAGTDDGLARSGDGGHHWRFLRGKNVTWRISGTYTGRAGDAMVSGIEILSPPDSSLPSGTAAMPRVAVAAGRSQAGDNWLADSFAPDDDPEAGQFSAGGVALATTESIALSADPADPAVANQEADLGQGPDPEKVAMFQAARYGTFTYTSPHLEPEEIYTVRLDFAEIYQDGPGQRMFDVYANGTRVLTGLDVFAAAGGRYRALIREFSVRTDKFGRIVLRFQGTKPVTVPANSHALLEDYVTCLAEDEAGHLWVGHQQTGVEVLDPVSGSRLYPATMDTPQSVKLPLVDEVASLLPGGGGALLGGYGFDQAGLQSLRLWQGDRKAEASTTAAARIPSPAGCPTLAELNALVRVVDAAAPDEHEMAAHVTALDDDWATEGDWLGRYGRYWAGLFALCSPDDYVWGAGWEPIKYASQQGPNHKPGDSLRYWVQWLYTSDPRVLEMPPTYLDSRIKKGLTNGSQPRREAEQDDHGEDYSPDGDGLGVYETVTVPAGLYVLSLYEVNYNGQSSTTRFRDYRISIRSHTVGKDLSDLTGFQDAPELAHGRVAQFRMGVWKRFQVRGPVDLTVQVDSNHSMNTMLPALTLDLVNEQPPPYFGTVVAWQAQETRQAQERQRLTAASLTAGSRVSASPSATSSEAAEHLMEALAKVRLINSSWWAINGKRFYGPLLRWYMAQPSGKDAAERQRFQQHLATCCYQMGLYPQWEECQKKMGLTPTREIEKALRWDGITDAGQGFQVVTSYLVSRHRDKISSKN